MFRGVKQDRKKLISAEQRKKEKLRDFPPKLVKSVDYSELAADLPKRDPLGVYKPCPKQERKGYYEYLHPSNKYDVMTLYEIVSRVRAKAEALPKRRDHRKEIDDLLSDLSRPLPKNKDEGGWLVATVDAYPDLESDFGRQGLDERLQRKMAESRNELAEFERVLAEKFGGKTKEMAGRIVLAEQKPARRFVAKNESGLKTKLDDDVSDENTFDEVHYKIHLLCFYKVNFTAKASMS